MGFENTKNLVKNKENEKKLSQSIAWLLQLGMLDKTERKGFFTLIQCKNISDDSKYLRSVHMKNAHCLPLNDSAHEYRIKLSQTPSINVPPFTYESTNLDYSKK